MVSPMSSPIVVEVSFKADRAKGAPELNGQSFTFSVAPQAVAALLSKQIANQLNGLVKGTPSRPAVSVAEAVVMVERIVAGGTLGKNTAKAQAVAKLLALPSDMLVVLFNASDRGTKAAIIAELERRNDGTPIPTLPPVRERKTGK